MRGKESREQPQRQDARGPIPGPGPGPALCASAELTPGGRGASQVQNPRGGVLKSATWTRGRARLACRPLGHLRGLTHSAASSDFSSLLLRICPKAMSLLYCHRHGHLCFRTYDPGSSISDRKMAYYGETSVALGSSSSVGWGRALKADVRMKTTC